VIKMAMDLETLRKHLSPKDFERMTAFMNAMPPEEREAKMKFMAERETLAPAVGAEAPDFELPTLEGGGRVRLSAFRGRKSVALIFGSYT
jgi:hypothetical protein